MLTPVAGRGDPFHGVGTIPAVRRLLESGWEAEAPPLARARRPLFRLLAEDLDPAFAYELGPPPALAGDPESVGRARRVLREAAAATLAQGGYEKDPRLRGAAIRIMQRLQRFLASPHLRDGGLENGRAEGRRLDMGETSGADASPPTMYTLLMLAYMPVFRREWSEVVSALGAFLGQPVPQHGLAVGGSRAGGGGPALPVLLGDPLSRHKRAEEDLPSALVWLELVARLGFLRPGTSWAAVYERLLDDCDANGVWRPRKAPALPRSTHPFVWPCIPLEAQLTGDARWTDVTFRLGLIGRCAGWQIELT